MPKKLLLTLLLAVLGASAAYSLLLINMKDGLSTDRAAMNRIVKLTEQNWGALQDELFQNAPYSFTVVDAAGTAVYQTSPALASTINEGINNRDIMIDVSVQGRTVGKVIISNDYSGLFAGMKRQFGWIFAATVLLLVLLCLGYVLYLNRIVFRPFDRMQRFARHIALGELEIPLEMDRSHMFGAFTESFDMMREQLAAARQSEYLANKSKKELVAGLSHDIKTPVSSIKAIVELMLLTASDDKTHRQLNMLYSKADQIDHLVTDMFHATMEELSELKITITEEHSRLLSEFIDTADYKNLITSAPVPECLIAVDPLRLQQVIGNVINNSSKYAGTPITAGFEICEGFLQVELTDYGPGVPEDELPLLFNKFYRGSNAAQQSGSGLGLYISRNLLRKMHGDIVCWNRPDESGFTVQLLIPLAGKN